MKSLRPKVKSGQTTLEYVIVFVVLLGVLGAIRLFVSAASANLSTVDQIKELFESADSAPYTLESLADRFHLSPFYLSHLFKNVTGISVMNYLLSCRMAHAKRLLADSDCSVDKIVSSCGFSDASNFCRIFKKQTGMTPGMFRKLNRH